MELRWVWTEGLTEELRQEELRWEGLPLDYVDSDCVCHWSGRIGPECPYQWRQRLMGGRGSWEEEAAELGEGMLMTEEEWEAEFEQRSFSVLWQMDVMIEHALDRWALKRRWLVRIAEEEVRVMAFGLAFGRYLLTGIEEDRRTVLITSTQLQQFALGQWVGPRLDPNGMIGISSTRPEWVGVRRDSSFTGSVADSSEEADSDSEAELDEEAARDAEAIAELE